MVEKEIYFVSLPQYVFMAWCLVKAQGQLYLLHLHRISIEVEHQGNCWMSTFNAVGKCVPLFSLVERISDITVLVLSSAVEVCEVDTSATLSW
jgi:hypothetical protein